MPLYLYQVVTPAGADAGEIFEVIQNMADPPLAAHPETGAAVRRLFTTPNLPRAWTSSQMKANLSDKSLDRMGFTKYVKGTDGKYDKVVGKGPSQISK